MGRGGGRGARLRPALRAGPPLRLETGSRAGLAIDHALAGDAEPLADYARAVGRIGSAYREGLAACYAAERRWPGRPFWRRRLTIS